MNDDDQQERELAIDEESGHEWVLPAGHVLVQCPKCSYTNDVPVDRADDRDFVEENCERCALPNVEHASIAPAFHPFDEETEAKIIEKSVASATRKVVKLAENSNRTDINIAEVGVMIARETMDTAFHVLSAEREYLRAADAVAARRSNDAGGSAPVVEEPDGAEPHPDGTDPS